jgi:hypothetical protein
MFANLVFGITATRLRVFRPRSFLICDFRLCILLGYCILRCELALKRGESTDCVSAEPKDLACVSHASDVLGVLNDDNSSSTTYRD